MTSIKKSGRFSYRTNKRYNYSRNNNSYSQNKLRPKGNVSALFDKYTKLAKEATSAGDRIQAEYYHQFADHYSRVMNENGIKQPSEESNIKESKKETFENVDENSNLENSQSLDNQDIPLSEKKNAKDENEEKDNSLEAVSFISQPPKKSRKTK